VEPEDLYELDSDRPDLTDSVLLQAMDGFVDAGATVKILRDHLLGLGEGRIIARFDVDLLYDYRARRPFLISTVITGLRSTRRSSRSTCGMTRTEPRSSSSSALNRMSCGSALSRLCAPSSSNSAFG
jgi:hypothetical protein